MTSWREVSAGNRNLMSSHPGPTGSLPANCRGLPLLARPESVKNVELHRLPAS
jgi:hypothetical protein